MTDPGTGRRLFHLTTPDSWEAAQAAGALVPDGFAEEGFVHCSTLDQLLGTITRHFPDAPSLALLELDPQAVVDDLRWEESRPGEVYPHLYRPLRAADVMTVWSWHRAPDGSIELPVGLR